MKSLYSFGSFALDPDRRALHRQGTPVPLTPKAFDLLLYLVKNPNRAITKEELLQGVWADSFVEEGNLTQNVFLLRKALAQESATSALIVTIPRKGYQFAAEVATVSETPGIVADKEPSRIEGKLLVQDVRAVTRIILEEETEEDTELPLERQLQALQAPDSRNWSRRPIFLLILSAVLAGAVAVWAFFTPRPMPKVLRSVQITQFGRAEPGSPVVTDGSRLYFTERIGGSWWLAQVAEQGGQPTVISTSVPGLALFDLDHSRSKLLVGEHGPNDEPFSALWEVPTGGGSAQRLGAVQASGAAWSPDGQTVAYSREGELFLVRNDGQQPQKLFSAAGCYIESPRWSPDGQRLSFAVMDLTTTTISLWEISAGGQNAHRLSLGLNVARRHRWGDGECCGDWSPDGKYFIFRSLHDGVASLWAVRQDTGWFPKARSTPVQLYTSPDKIGEPRFSTDGKKVFFIDFQLRRELVRYDSLSKSFVPYLGGIPARLLSFSRDGRWVAYKNEEDGSLWRSRLDGTQALQLTFPPLEAMHSTWSPDGKRIVFQADGKLYQVPFEGGNLEPLLPKDGFAGQPNWSPDGGSLLFVRRSTSETGGWHPAIYRLDLKTRQVQWIPGSGEFECPQWSPDGKYAAASDTKGHKLVLFDFARQQWSELADGTPYGWGIRWSADSRYVYYQHLSGGEEQPIFRVRLTDRKVEQITSSRQILRADILSYSMTGLAPDNSPLVSFVRRNSDVYALELELP